MNPLDIKQTRKGGPESKIQDDIAAYLRARKWFVMPTHGNMYQHGFPDLYCTHFVYGARWVEVKLPKMQGSKFTPAQLEYFPQICANGSGVWILVAAIKSEYDKLFSKCNWWHYLEIWRS
jgi:hypothetical protein